jgi:hypothetical protein
VKYNYNLFYNITNMKVQLIISLVLTYASTQSAIAAPVQVQGVQRRQPSTDDTFGILARDVYVENAIKIRSTGGAGGGKLKR